MAVVMGSRFTGMLTNLGRNPLRLSLYSITLAALLAFVLPGDFISAKTSDSAYTLIQSDTAKDILTRLRRRHYADLRIDDDFSSRLLDQYLNTLDSSHTFLLQSDVDEFEKYRFELDDLLKDGDLQLGYEVFERYRKRMTGRLENSIENLDEDLAALDFTVDEYIEIDRSEAAWPRNKQAAEEIWRKTFKASVLGLKLAGKEMDEISELLKERYSSQLKRTGQINGEDIFQLYINAVTGLFDPHTNYLSPRTSENFNIAMSLSLEGIGAVLQREGEHTKVVRLVPAGPADKQGQLQPADRIVAVGQGTGGEMVDVVGWRLDDVVDLIRGKKGTRVRLEVIPADTKADDVRVKIQIVRNKVKLEEQAAQKEILEIWSDGKLQKVGVIQIPAFYIDFEALQRGDPNYKSTTRDVAKLLSELLEEKVKGIIIDLRSNGGGSLQEANSLTGLFIKSGPTVQIKHSSSRIERKTKPSGSPFFAGPLVVLIDRLSASASEIFAGAIQDYQRGVIVGGQTFGKGTVQSMAPLEHGYIKLTESKFYRISGESTQHRGVLPDVPFPAIYDKERIGESSLDNALAWDRIAPVRHDRYYDLEAILPQLNDLHSERIGTDPDFIYLQDQLALAADSDLTQISLNEEARKSQRIKDKEQQLQLENKRRASKGQEPLKALEVTEDEEEPDIAGTSDEDSDPNDDVILTEAGNILLDSVKLFQRLALNLTGS